jgi:anti-anti-sigma factor
MAGPGPPRGSRARRAGWEIEFRLGRADGAFHWLLERAVPIGAEESFAGYVGSCTDINARFRETERQTLLAVVGAALDREPSSDEQLERLARLVVESRLADMCTVRRVDDDGHLHFAGIAAHDPAIEADLAGLEPHSVLGAEVLATGRSILLTASGPDDQPLPLGMYSSMTLPLLVRGEVIAVLAVGRRADAPPFNDDDRSLAEEICARAALALDNAVLLAEERAAAQRLALLQQVTAELSAATTPVDVGVAAAERIRQLTGAASRVAVYELDASHRGLAMLTISGGSEERQRLWTTIPLSAPLAAAQAAREGRAIWIEDTGEPTPTVPRELPEEVNEAIASFGLAATVALPLAVAGRTVGVIGIAYPDVQRFSPTDRAMLLAMAEQCAQALDRARMFRAERRIAETLQRSLLPAELPSLRRLALAAHYLPGAEGTQAGGDWYDVVELEDDRVAIAVGDVVGQGPAAAAVMGQLRSALSAALLQGCGPAEALELLDRFAARLPGALASTAACLLIDPVACTIRWSRAGHLPPLLLTPDGAHRLLTEAGAGAVLGAVGRGPYTEGTVTIPPGATLLLYTDGLVERRGELIDAGLDRIRTVAGRHVAVGPDLLTDRLLAEVLADTDQPDDVAVIAARLLPDDLSGVLPPDPDRLAEIRRRVRTWSAGAGLSEVVREDLLLALGEALANAVEHAYAYTPNGDRSGECEFLVRREPDGSVHVRVTDGGVWRPPPQDKGHRGRGLELIAALAVDVEVGPAPGPGTGTVVSFRLPPVSERAQANGSRTPDVRPPLPATAPGNSGVWAGDGVPARVSASEGRAGLRLEVAGELDLGTTTAVREALLAALQGLPQGATAELDLTLTTYLASAGVGMILQLIGEAAARGVELRLHSPEDSATARVFALTGLGGLLGAGASTAASSGGRTVQ